MWTYVRIRGCSFGWVVGFEGSRQTTSEIGTDDTTDEPMRFKVHLVTREWKIWWDSDHRLCYGCCYDILRFGDELLDPQWKADTPVRPP